MWSLLFVSAHAVIAATPYVSSWLLGDTVNALIGARGIGTMTKELSTLLWYSGGAVLIVFLAYIFTLKFSGRAALAGRVLEITLALFLVSIGLALHGRLSALFVFLLLHLLLSMYRERKIIAIGILALAIIAAVLETNTIVHFTISRSLTIGEGITVITLVIWSLGLLKLRFIRSSPGYALHN